MKSADLAEHQRLMQQALINPEKADIAELIHESRRMTAQQHLSIYQRSYIVRLQQCMIAQFSALAFALGEPLFNLFVAEYVKVHPSKSHTLNDLGLHFPRYLQQTRPDANAAVKEDWPDFMIELAQFEFALNQLFDAHAEDDQASEVNADTPEQHWQLPTVTQCFEHQFPVLEYYQQYKAGQQPQLPFPALTHCLVIRKNYRLGLFALNPSQYQFFKLMQQYSSVAVAKQYMIETLGYNPQQFAQIWPKWREHWLTQGIFVEQSIVQNQPKNKD